jgi:NAD(P)-dependent dehydrogenase (short-subunit alcohol dehydrogenase family)
MARVALVTGGWRGIGRAAVEVLRAEGLRVALTHVPGHEPEDGVAALVAGDAGLMATPLDLRDPVGPAAAVAAVAGRWGGVDVLVNNAAVGTATVAAFASDPAAQDALMLQINAAGTLGMCLAFLAVPGTGSEVARKIINIASVGGGIAAFPGFRLSDGMSKAAVAHLTRQLAAEQMAPGVDVFALCPGATNTAMFHASTLAPMTPEARADFVAGLPKGRLIEPDEIARIVAFLAGPHSTPLHGAVIDASMGLGVRPGRISEGAH